MNSEAHTPNELAQEARDDELRRLAAGNLNSSERRKLCDQAAATKRREIALRIEANELLCFVRNVSGDGWQVAPSDCPLFDQVRAFLSNRARPIRTLEQKWEYPREGSTSQQETKLAGFPARITAPQPKTLVVTLALDWADDFRVCERPADWYGSSGTAFDLSEDFSLRQAAAAWAGFKDDGTSKPSGDGSQESEIETRAGVLAQAVKRGELPASNTDFQWNPPGTSVTYLTTQPECLAWRVTRADLRDWFSRCNQRPEFLFGSKKTCIDVSRARQIESGAVDTLTATMVEQRAAVIRLLADDRGLDNIVDDEVKATLRDFLCDKCNGEPWRFTKPTFDKAWQLAKDRIRCLQPEAK